MTAGTIPAQEVSVGQPVTVPVSAYFSDPDGDALSYTAASSDAEVATASVSGSTVTVTGVTAGAVTVTVTARDPGGLSAQQSFAVTAEWPRPEASLSATAPTSPEGGVAIVEVILTPPEVIGTPPRELPITVSYTLGVDADLRTADADATDYAIDANGVVEIGAEANSAAIEITIHDDDEIEPVREVFTVTLEVPTAEAGYQLGSVTSVVLTIEEGVCDRTPQVGDEIVQQAGVGDCAQVEDRHLASIHGLDLCFPKEEWQGCRREDDPITVLREGDFLGFSGLEWLNLAGNGLTALPEGVFSGLSRLISLELYVNELTALPEGVFSGLSNLEDLPLFGNRLTELPAGTFSGLSKLWNIGLDSNGLTELPVGIFADLSRLGRLDLGGNDLIELPEGVFSDLASLEWLNLAGNGLTALPEGVFSGLGRLKELRLANNPGSPFTLTAEMTRTDSGDPTSPGPATLEFRVAEGAPYAMTIPLTVRGGTLSRPSASFTAGATVAPEATLTPDGSGAGVSVAFGPVPTVCEDPESNTEGPKCSGLEIVAGDLLVVANPETVALSVPAAYLTQATQELSGGVPLIAGREALLRVFGTADEYYTLGQEGQATFFVRGQEVHSASLEPPASGVPLNAEEGRLGHSFNARIPGHVLQPGLEMVVELDPDGALPLKPGSSSRFPASGRLALDVREVPPMNLTIVPVLYREEVNRSTNPEVEDFTRDLVTTDSDGALRFTRDILPIGDLSVKLREPYYTLADTEGGADRIFQEIWMLRHLEAGGDEYYHGIAAFPNTENSKSESNWPGGLGAEGYSAVSWEFWGPTIAHELGHNLSLGHAPCGNPGDLDPDFPYADGSIGVWGYRLLHGDDTGFGRLFSPVHKDLMSYCFFDRWISNYNFTKALDHRLAIASAPVLIAQRAEQETLLLWGGVQEGQLQLEPAFAYHARLKLPEVSGPYQLTGLDAEGRSLFSLSFTPDELDHGGSSFLFAIPFETEWTEDLDRIALMGPEGSTTLDRDTGGRAALIIDRASGQVRTIARDWSVGDASLPAAMASDAQVEIIRGLPSR